MPSKAHSALNMSLTDVDALIADHPVVTGGGKGKPAEGKGIEITRAGIVLLAGAVEGFVEDLFDEAVDLIHAGRTDAERKKLKKATSGRLNNADSEKTNALFSHLGLPWALEDVKWAKFSNASFIASPDGLVAMRNKIAHGRAPKRALLADLKRWRTMVGNYAVQLDRIIAKHVGITTGTTPQW